MKTNYFRREQLKRENSGLRRTCKGEEHGNFFFCRGFFRLPVPSWFLCGDPRNLRQADETTASLARHNLGLGFRIHPTWLARRLRKGRDTVWSRKSLDSRVHGNDRVASGYKFWFKKSDSRRRPSCLGRGIGISKTKYLRASWPDLHKGTCLRLFPVLSTWRTIH